jgi:hypothetical protein
MSAPSITVEEKGFADANNVPTRALVDSDRHVQCDVLTLANSPNFDVALSTRASEATLNALKNALSSVGADKVRVSVIDSLPAGANKIGSVDVESLPSLPAGTNKIGSVDAYKAGTWNVDNLLNPHPVSVTNQIARDADGHGQVDVLTMPSISVSLEEKGFADANNVPTRALVDSDRHVQCDVLTMPSVSVSLETPYPVYAVAVNASAVAASKHHLSIWNGSSSYVKVRKAAVSMHSTATVSGFIMQFIMQRASAISGGTALTIVKLDNRDPDLPSGISAATGATVTLKEAPIAIFTLNPEETGSQGFVQFDVPKPIVVAPNEGITIQQYATAGVGLFNAVVYFTVETS